MRRCSPTGAHGGKTRPQEAEDENDHIQFIQSASIIELQREVLLTG